MDNFLAGRKILVVEDEMLVLMMIEMMLEDMGCETMVAASTVESALARIGENDFDLAMLDMNLGGRDSRPIASELDDRNVPYLFCTGNSSGDPRIGVRERPILHKPFQLDLLAQALANLLLERDNLVPAA